MATKRRGIKQILNVVIYPAPDLPGQWVSHCLELDVVSQGNSASQALDMMAEAIELCAEENVRAGNPPLLFRSAPLEVWKMAADADEAAIRPLHLPDSPVRDDVTLAPHFRRAS